MEIQQIKSDLLKSNMYIISENGHSVVIDPCITEREMYTDVDLILLTHEHYDHISGVNYWKKKTNAPIICSVPCGKNITSPRKNLSRYFDVFCELQTWMSADKNVTTDAYKCEADETFMGEKIIQWQKHNFKLVSTPGHSAGSICIILDENILFSGDSLMKNYPTECKFPGGNVKEWNTISLPFLFGLNSMHVYPGHFEDFILEECEWFQNMRRNE